MMVWASLLAEVENGRKAALISILRALGSTPREAGARMIVTVDGSIGTIGGGALEFQAIAHARDALDAVTSDQPRAPMIQSQALGPDLGQCCGGRVEIVTEVFGAVDLDQLRTLAAREAAGRFTMTGRIVDPDYTEQFGERRGKLYLFGAGHVGHAIVTALMPLVTTSLTTSALPIDIVWIDNRPECFVDPVPTAVTCLTPEDPAEIVASIEPGSYVLVLTHDHAIDYHITAAALRRHDLVYVGLIGSSTKRARFVRRFRDEGLTADELDNLTCPIGLTTIRSKHPAAIAASVVAELLMKADDVKNAAIAPTEPVQLQAVRRAAGPAGDACCSTDGKASSCVNCQQAQSKETAAVIQLDGKVRDRAG